MTVIVYRSTDAGAPKRTGAVGSDAAILKACLVTGYGSKAGAGWNNPFSATNIEVFRQGGGNQRYLRVDDSRTNYPYTAYFRAYESMTSVAVGVAPMPATIDGVTLPRSTGGETLPDRPWVVVATDKSFYFFASVYAADNERAYPQMMFYGDIQSYVPGDQFNTALIGNPLDGGYSGTQQIQQLVATPANINSMHFMARKYDQVGGPISFGKHADMGKLGTTTSGAGYMQYPNPADGGFYLSPIWVNEQGAASNQGVVRGVMPGLWTHCHPVGAARLHDQVPGTGAMAGKIIEFFTFGSGGEAGSVGVEISDTWY